MHRKRIVSIIVAGAVLMVGIVSAVTYRVVNAQSATQTPSTGSATTTANLPGFDHGMKGGFYTQQDLASALNVTLEQLQAAETSATTQALNEAVSTGLITQSQADQFLQNSPIGYFDNDLPFLKGSSIDYNSLLASALGISTDQLQTARQTAYFAAIDLAVQNGRMTQAQADLAKGNYGLSNNTTFQNSMKTAYTAAVNQAVADGVITQAQADQLLSNYNGYRAGDLGGRHMGGGHGGPGGFGDPGLWGGPAQGNSSSTTGGTPTATP